jgi:hypothetical protein
MGAAVGAPLHDESEAACEAHDEPLARAHFHLEASGWGESGLGEQDVKQSIQSRLRRKTAAQPPRVGGLEASLG